MILDSLLGLTSISQWGLFLGITFVIFGWIEKREVFVFVGLLIFLALGLISAWILLTDQITVPQTAHGVISKQVRALSFFKGVVAFSTYTIICLLLKIFKFRYEKISLYILLAFALALFFMVFNIQEMAG